MMKPVVKYSVLGALSLGLVGLAIAGPALARGDHGERQGARFEILDSNADGFVTAEEMEARRLARFTEQDTDQDGFLSLKEMQAATMKRFDGQGRQEGQGRQHGAEEMADRSQRMLRFMDENGDGKVAFDEMPGNGTARMIARFDIDEDGKISKAEFDEAKSKFRMGHKGERHGQRNN